MYTSGFGLKTPPFSISPDPRCLYLSEPHRNGLAHLVYGVQQHGGFVQLTGEVGTGKTTLWNSFHPRWMWH
jgi:general secretion pathway protein A